MIIGGKCYSWKLEMAKGIHQETDEYRIALFTEAAFIGPSTTSYSGQAGEVQQGNGYKTGGKALSGFKAVLEGESALVDFDDAIWPNSRIIARGGLIYNASKDNRAVCVLDFGENVTSTNGPFKVEFPTPDVEHAFLVLD
jgi:hypothetical protein